MRQVLKCCSFLLSLSLSAVAQIPNVDRPAHQRLMQWLAVFDGNNKEAYRTFFKEEFSSAMGRVDQDWGIRQHTGGFNLVKIQDESATKVTALLQERLSDQFAKIVLEVEAIEPQHLLKMEIGPIELPAEFAPPHLTEKELTSALRERLKEVVTDDGYPPVGFGDGKSAHLFSGAVLVAKSGKSVFEEGYGLGGSEHSAPNTITTRFSIGSVNKMFTAVLILQLVEAGKIKLDAPLGEYLHDYPNKDVASKVTIDQLLSHTGGTGDFFGPLFDRHRAELHSHQDYVKLFGDRPLRFEPGSRFEYSNYGFILLGRVIEEITGEDYYDYVRAHVYVPADMTSTGAPPIDEAIAHRTGSYQQMGSGEWTSAGGGYSTVGDLLRFANALQDNKLLTAHSYNLMTTGKVDAPGVGQYGYGVEVRTLNGSHCVGHSGGNRGINAELEVVPDSHYTVVVLANMNPPAAQKVSDFITNRLPLPTPDQGHPLFVRGLSTIRK
jgi:D-alanyl-D-alanine carboxypeptidase